MHRRVSCAAAASPVWAGSSSPVPEERRDPHASRGRHQPFALPRGEDLVDYAMRIPTRTKLGNLTQIIELHENEPLDSGAVHALVDEHLEGR